MILALVLTSAVLGAVASLRNSKDGIGKEFLEGLYSIGPIFVATAGIMASVPVLSHLIQTYLGPLFQILGADPAISATSIIAVDMGGYLLSHQLAQSPEGWILAVFTGYLAGATIVFSIPVALTLLPKSCHHQFALGTLAGLLSIPFAVVASTLLATLLESQIRTEVVTQGAATYALHFQPTQVFFTLLPLAVFMIFLALGLYFFTDFMIRGFIAFGRVIEIATRLILVFCIVEHFSGFFTGLGLPWPFDPLFADEKDLVRAIEIAGYIGIMLSGAFPMVYLLRKFLQSVAEPLGKKLGLSPLGTVGVIASSANILALLRLMPDMPKRDQVLTSAYAVCAAFLLGDHLAFTMNFQPDLVWPIFAGKLLGGVLAIVLARALCLRKIVGTVG